MDSRSDVPHRSNPVFLGGVDFLGSNLDLALKSSAEYRLCQDVIFHAPILV